MKIQGRHVGGLATLLALGAMLGPGCAENKSSLFIRGAMVVPGDSCTVTADASAVLRSRGAFDTAIAGEYSAVVLVGNQLVRRGNSATLRTETSRIVLKSADVRLLDASGNSIGEFSAPTSGFVDPSPGGTEPGYGFASLVLVDAAAAAAVVPKDGSRRSVEVTANVIVHGETLGGSEVDAGEWQFPIDVCEGCLIIFPPEADVPGDPRDCNNTADGPTEICRPGLDEFVDCRICSGTNPLCQP